MDGLYLDGNFSCTYINVQIFIFRLVRNCKSFSFVLYTTARVFKLINASAIEQKEFYTFEWLNNSIANVQRWAWVIIFLF